MPASKEFFVWRAAKALLRLVAVGRLAGVSRSVDAEGAAGVEAVAEASQVAHAALVAAAVEPATGAFAYRPLAAQLAFTSRRNVRKGRKAAPMRRVAGAKKAARLPRQASAIKAKPVTRVLKKKRSAKRRHVWLSTHSRVIKPITFNVVAMQMPVRSGKTAARSSGQKAVVRQLRLAA